MLPTCDLATQRDPVASATQRTQRDPARPSATQRKPAQTSAPSANQRTQRDPLIYSWRALPGHPLVPPLATCTGPQESLLDRHKLREDKGKAFREASLTPTQLSPNARATQHARPRDSKAELQGLVVDTWSVSFCPLPSPVLLFSCPPLEYQKARVEGPTRSHRSVVFSRLVIAPPAVHSVVPPQQPHKLTQSTPHWRRQGRPLRPEVLVQHSSTGPQRNELTKHKVLYSPTLSHRSRPVRPARTRSAAILGDPCPLQLTAPPRLFPAPSVSSRLSQAGAANCTLCSTSPLLPTARRVPSFPFHQLASLPSPAHSNLQ